MLNFEFISPTKFIFGKDAETRIGDIAAKYGTKALVYVDDKFAKKSGLIDRVVNSLNQAGIKTVLLGGVMPNPRASKVYEGIELCRKEKVDLIVAVGGGSTIDSAKATSIGVLYDGDFWDFYSGKQPTKRLPLGVVLTIAAAGSEGSLGSVITNEDGWLKRSCDCDLMRPDFSIMNPELTYTLPPFQTACGVADIIAHVLERYITNTTGVDLTDGLSEAVITSVIRNAPIVLKKPDDYDARANIMWAGMVAQNGIMGVGCEEDWSSHLLEHELSALYDVAHGAGLTVILPAFMRYQYKYNVMRFARFAVNVFGVIMDFEKPERTAEEGIDHLEAFFKSCGLPTTFAELGAKQEDIPVLVEKCNFNNGEYLGYFHPINRQQAAEIYKLACG
jgi:alcohol dehydrogenase YqhD (iron-dependent ADH family)